MLAPYPCWEYTLFAPEPQALNRSPPTGSLTLLSLPTRDRSKFGDGSMLPSLDSLSPFLPL